MMTTVTIPAICDMDVSNLTGDQLEVMRLLIDAAESGFHYRSVDNNPQAGAGVSVDAKQHADACQILLDRLQAERVKRYVANLAQPGEDDERS
tara:strand:+ start:547 stop:825 length:279 start_codon:yes stop_codon:yes gene_type:complete